MDLCWQGFPGSSDGKEYACDEGDPVSIPRLARSPGEGNGTPLQYSWNIGLVYSTDRGIWWATVHGLAESDTTEWLTETGVGESLIRYDCVLMRKESQRECHTKGERHTGRWWPLDNSGRHSSEASAGPGSPKTGSYYQKQEEERKDFLLWASDETWPCHRFVLLGPRTVSKWIVVVLSLLVCGTLLRQL